MDHSKIMDNSKNLLLVAMNNNLDIVGIVCQSTLDDNMKKEKLDKLRESMKTYCHVSNNLKKYEQCTAEIETGNISEDSENKDFKELLEVLSKQKEDVRSHEMYRKFEEKIRTSQTEDDEDMVISESAPNIICPVSKQIMKNPVKNVLCGHTYDKSSVDGLLKVQKRGIKCPVAGCVRAVSFTHKQLQPNDTLRNYISQQMKDK